MELMKQRRKRRKPQRRTASQEPNDESFNTEMAACPNSREVAPNQRRDRRTRFRRYHCARFWENVQGQARIRNKDGKIVAGASRDERDQAGDRPMELLLTYSTGPTLEWGIRVVEQS
jgi:hypothetical protein